MYFFFVQTSGLVGSQDLLLYFGHEDADGGHDKFCGHWFVGSFFNGN